MFWHVLMSVTANILLVQLLPPASFLLSPVSCPLPPISCPLSPASCLLVTSERVRWCLVTRKWAWWQSWYLLITCTSSPLITLISSRPSRGTGGGGRLWDTHINIWNIFGEKCWKMTLLCVYVPQNHHFTKYKDKCKFVISENFLSDIISAFLGWRIWYLTTTAVQSVPIWSTSSLSYHINTCLLTTHYYFGGILILLSPASLFCSCSITAKSDPKAHSRSL